LHQKKGPELETHPTWMCFMLGVCERGSSTKTPTLGVFELKKECDIGVLLCSVCVEHETTHVGWPLCSPSTNTYTNMVFSCLAYVGLPVWVEDGGGCGDGQLIGSRCSSCHVIIRKLPYLDYVFRGNYHSKYVVLTGRGGSTL